VRIGVMVSETYEEVYGRRLGELGFDELYRMTKNTIEYLRELGIECYEFCVEDCGTLVRLIRVLDRLDVDSSCIQIHDTENSVRLAYRNPEIREKAVEELKAIIEAVSDNNIEIVTIHPPYFRPPFKNYEPSPHVEKSLEYSEAYREMILNLKKISSYAHKRSVVLGLENMNFFHIEGNKVMISAHFGRNSREILDILSKVNNASLKVTFDIGHANLTQEKPEGFYSKTAELVVNIHVNNNYGKRDNHYPLSRGIIDFKKVFTLIAEKGYKGSVIIERSCDNYITEDIAILKKYLLSMTGF